MPSPLQRLRCQYDGDFYLMELSLDRFVHFTTRDRAAEIIESGRLLMRPPYKKFGIDAVAAVSTVWGSFVPGVQTTHIDSDKRDLVGVVFQTRVMPEVGYPEEVLWKQDVVLVNPKVVSYAKAKGMIRGASDFDGQVYYAVPSWCDGVEGQSRIARASPRIKEAIEESMANLPDRLRWAIDDFAAGVIMGEAPSLEQHTSTLYKAFAPLRKALGGTTTMYRGQPIDPPKIDRKWLSWTTEPRMAALFTGVRGDQIIEAKVKSSDVVAGILSPNNPDYIEFLVKNRPEYQTRSQKQVPIYYALYMPLNPRFYDDMPENYGDLSDREQLEFSYPDWKRWLKDNERAVERAGGLVLNSDPPKMNPDEESPFLGVLMPADVKLPPALAALDDAKYGRPEPRYMGKVAGLSPLAYKYIVLDAHAELNPHVSDWVFSGNKAAKEALFRAYEGLDDNEKDALDHEVRGVMPSSLTVYRSVRPGQPLDRGGSSVTDDLSTRTGEVHAWRITPADVLLHYGQKESWLASKAYGHEREIILKPNAKPKYLGPVEQRVASAARVASRHIAKRAGLLDVPPKVVDEVYQWCMERLCSEWLEHQLPYKREQIRRKLEGANEWQRDFQEKRLVNLKLVEREAKKWGSAGASFSGQRDNTWLGYIDTDFNGWRYASEIHTRTGKTPDELAKEMRKDRFFLTLKDNQQLDGMWIPSTTHRGWAMEIRTNFDPHDLKTWRSRTQELRKVIAHETGHLAQSYLDLFLNLGTPGEDMLTSGLPGSDLAEPGYDPLGNRITLYGNPLAELSGRQTHALREVEFYTRLRDEVEDFVLMAKRIPKNAWREALRVWVAADERSYSDPLRFRVPGEPSRDVRNSDFFKTIKQNRRKWQKAVSLFVDEVGKRISIPSAARVASASLRGAFMRHTSDQYDEWLTETYEEDADEVRDDSDVFDDFLDETFGIEINDTHKAVELSYADDDNEWLLRKVDPPVLLYHHTTDAFKDSIRREGLRVGQERSDRLPQNTQAGVYLTLEAGGTVPRGYIQNAIRNYGGRPLSLTVRADWSDLWPDPDDADISSGRSQFVTSYVPPRDIVEYD